MEPSVAGQRGSEEQALNIFIRISQRRKEEDMGGILSPHR